MNISRRCATIVASLVIFASIPAFAQSAGTSVVVLDVGKVFKEHRRFKQKMETMKGDVTNFENYLKSQRTKVQNMVTELKEKFKTGTPGYAAQEKQIAKISSDMEVETRLKRKEFVQHEAKIFYDTYQEITSAVAQFATKYKIDLVLRFNSEPINPDNPQQILAGVNQNIVYHSKPRDVTVQIIEMLNGRAGPGISTRPTFPGRPTNR